MRGTAAAALAVLLGAGPLHAQAEAPETCAVDAPAGAELVRLELELARLRAEIEALRTQPPGGDAAARLAALEAAVARLAEQVRQMGEEAQANAGAVDALSRDGERRTSLTIYGQFEAVAYRGEPVIFDGHTFEVVLSGHPHRRLAFFGEIEFERVAAVGGERGGEIVVEQAWAGLELAPALHLRAGVVLVPFGNVNIDHYAPRRDVVTKPLVSYVVAPSDWTDNGLGLTGQRLLGTVWLVGYEVYVVAGLGSEVSGVGMRAARQGYGVDNNGDKALAGRVAVTRAGRFQAGLSGYRGRYDDAGQRTLRGVAVDAHLQLGSLQLTGEVNDFRADRGPDRPGRLRGWYGRAVVDVLRGRLRETPVGRDFDDPRLALVAQLDGVRVDGPVDGRFEESRERRLTLGLNVRPSPQWVLKASWEWNDNRGLPLVAGDRDGFVGAVGFVF